LSYDVAGTLIPSLTNFTGYR